MVRELRDANPSVPVLVLTRAEDPEASEVLSKDCAFAQILAAVGRLGDEA
jgi:hypothetical protein